MLNAVSFFGEGIIESIHRDSAVRNIDDTVTRARRQETNVEIPVWARLLKVRSDLGPVVPLLWGRNGILNRMLNPGHALEQFAHLLLLPPELLLVIEMLILTSTAGGK